MNHPNSMSPVPPKAGSSADLRVVNNDGPTVTTFTAITNELLDHIELIEQIEGRLAFVLTPPNVEDGAEKAPERVRMATDLGEAQYVLLEHARKVTAALKGLRERILI